MGDGAKKELKGSGVITQVASEWFLSFLFSNLIQCREFQITQSLQGETLEHALPHARSILYTVWGSVTCNNVFNVFLYI